MDHTKGRPPKPGRGRNGIPTYLRLSPQGRAWLEKKRRKGESFSDVIERMAQSG